MKKWLDIIEELPPFLRECFDKDWNKNLKECKKCNRDFPMHQLFFLSKGASECKECYNNTSFINIHTSKLFKSYIPNDMKYCNGCGQILPKNLDYFNSKGNNNFYSLCKLCRGFKNYGQHLNGINTKLAKDEKKKCKYCEKVKDISDFPKVRNSQVVNAEYCTECKYIFDEEDKSRRNSSEYKEQKRIYDKSYYEKNKDKKLEYHKSWKSSDRGRLISKEIDKKRESRKLGLYSDLTTKEWVETLEYFSYSCSYCGISEDSHIELYNKRLSQEHIVPVVEDGMYTNYNIIPACTSCNSKKNKYDLESFYEKEDSFTHDRYLNVIDYLLSRF